MDHAVLDAQPSFDEPAHRARIDLVLAGQQPCRQRFGGVLGPDLDGRLQNDGTVVQRRGDEMHAGAVHLDAGLQRLLVGMQAGEAGQQRRMDVHHPAGIVLDELGRQDPHEAGQHHQVGHVGVDRVGQRLVEAGPVGIVAMIDHADRNALRRGELEAGRVGTAGQHGGDPCRPGLLAAGPDDRFHVGTASRDKDDDIFHRAILPRRRPATARWRPRRRKLAGRCFPRLRIVTPRSLC